MGYVTPTNAPKHNGMMRSFLPWIAAVLLLAAVPRASAQQPDTTKSWYDDAWSPIVTRDSVAVSYIFYEKADNQNNGVVLRLQNHNTHPVRYAFRVVFRAADAETTATAEGRLLPGQMKTGDGDGLFWIPFTDGRTVAQVGLRGFYVWREDEAEG